MLELIIQWGEALEKGGPWFLVAIEGAVIVLILRFALKRIDSFRNELRGVYAKKEEDKDAAETKLRLQEDKYREAMQTQTREHQGFIEDFFRQVREREEKNTQQLLGLTSTLAKSVAESDSITSEHTKAIDRLSDEISRCRVNS